MQQLELEDGLLDRIVNKVSRDTFGYFYLFFDQGIQQYDGKNFNNVNSVQLNNTDLSDVHNIFMDDQGGIQFTINKTIFSIPAGSTKVKKVPQQNTPPAHQSIPQQTSYQFKIDNQMYRAEKGTIWTNKNSIVENISLEEAGQMNCHMLKKDKKGNYIAFFGYNKRSTERILVIRANGTVEDFSFLLNYNNNIKDLYTDNIDAKWLIATFNGIFVFNFSHEGIENYHTRKNLQKSQFGNIITSVNTETDQILFLKETDGLRTINQEGKVELLFEDQPEYFHRNQLMIYDDYHQNFYSFSYDLSGEFELYKFNIQKNIADIDQINLRIRDLYNLDKDHLLIGGHDLFLEKDDKSGKIFKYNKEKRIPETILDNLPAVQTINFIKSTKEFWIGTKYGIYIYDEDFQFKEAIVSDVNSKTKYLSHPEIRTMLEFHEYVIAGSYSGGIYIIDKVSKEVIKNISEANGLSDNAAIGLIRDNEDNIWVATFNGLTVLNEKLNIIETFYEYNGLPNREFNTRAIDKDKDGNLYLGTLNGLVKINPKQLLNRKTTHGLHLKSLTAFKNRSSQTFSNLSEEVELYTNYDSLKLSLSFPDYYRYRFDNWSASVDIDDSLLEYSKINGETMTISHLPKGNYNFSFNNNSNPHTETLKVELTRDNRRLILISSLILLITGLSYLFFKFRIRQLRKFEEEKTKINKKIAELELTALRSQMNPHFIFNALGAIQYFIQTQKTEKADSFLSSFAKLMRKILDSSKSKYITLQEEVELLTLYVDLEKVRFEKLFDIEISIDPEIDLENPVPPMIIQPFLENAINHGLYHLTERDGKLSILFKHINEMKMLCVIKDNGIGRAAANKLKKPNHKSRGIEIVKDRIQTINSQADIKINIETKDLYHNKEASGTQIEITFEYEE